MHTDTTVGGEFLFCATYKLREQIEKIETCVDRLTVEQLWIRGSEGQNSIGNLMLHLAGNVRQWILHGVAGEADHRVRDWEFSNRETFSGEELKRRLRASVDPALELFEGMTEQELMQRTSVQNYDGITKLRAIMHVVEHFSGHAGQIIFMTKWFTGEELGFYRHLADKAHGRTAP